MVWRRRGGGREGNNHLEDSDLGDWIILKWILHKLYGTVWAGYIWLRIWTSGEFVWTLINFRGPQNMRTSLIRFARTLLCEADSFSEYYSLRLVKWDSWATVPGWSFAQCAAKRGSVSTWSHLWCQSPRGVVGGWWNSVRCGSVVSKESSARLREWRRGVGSWQGQGRSSHFTEVRTSIQLLVVEKSVLHVLKCVQVRRW